MIKFFRKIRQKLVVENRFNKYLLYAVGEIILVVIGILIALQINNWNEQQKVLTEEQKILKALKGEIKNNIENLDKTIKINKESQKKSRAFFKKFKLKNKNEYDVKQLVGVFGYSVNRLDISILEEILGTNSRALISNDQTLIQLRKLKQKFNRTQKIEFYIDSFWNNYIIDFFKKSGLGIYMNNNLESEDIEGVIKIDKDFFSLLGLFNASQESFLLSENELKKELEATLIVLNNNIDD